MPRGLGSREGEVEVQTTPPETVGPVTVVTEELPAVENAKAPLSGLIRVRGAGSDGKVVLWETDERHPGGQAWLCNDGKAIDLFPTAAVLRGIKDGSILRVNWNS